MTIRTILAAAAMAACGSTQVKAEEAEAAYLAQQLRCVESNPDRPSIDACRADVRAKWDAARDGGKDRDR